MQLRILGCSGTYPTPNSPTSGYLIEDGSTKIWVDCGIGTFAALQQVTSFLDIDALVLTHLHPDHCLDIFSLYYALRFAPESRFLPVYAPFLAEEHLSQMLIGDPSCTMGKVFDFRSVSDGVSAFVGGIRLDFCLTDHPIPTYAIRASSSSCVLTFSADTGPRATLDEFARGSDVFLCEATYQQGDRGSPLHLFAAQAGELGKRAGVRDLVLTHFSPQHDPWRSYDEAVVTAGGVSVHVAEAGRALDVRTGTWLDCPRVSSKRASFLSNPVSLTSSPLFWYGDGIRDMG